MWEWMAAMPALRSDLNTRSQFIFNDGEVATDYDVLIRTGKCRPSAHPHCIIKIDAVDLARCPKVNLIIPCSATNILLAT